MSSRRASSYAQVSAAVRAMKSRMFHGEGYDRLLRSSSSAECTSILREQDYFEEPLAAVEMVDQLSWHNLFDLKISRLVEKLIRLSPRDCEQLLTEFQRRNRLELLKSGLRMMSAPEAAAAFSITATGPSADLLRSAVESRNIELLVNVAGAHDLLAQISSALAENTPIALMEGIVDKHALARMWSATNLRDSVDRQSARPLVGEDIDITNLLLAVRLKALGITDEETRRVLVPANHRLGSALSEAIESGSATNALRAFTRTAYGEIVSPFLETFKEGAPLQPLETSLRRSHAKTCLLTFSGFPFCAGLPLAFAYLMGYEVSDLRSIISGKQDALLPERIRDFLIL